jgi:hypothetical protein
MFVAPDSTNTLKQPILPFLAASSKAVLPACTQRRTAQKGQAKLNTNTQQKRQQMRLVH